MSASSLRLCAKNASFVSNSPSTSAPRMNSSRARAGSCLPNATRRRWYTGSPYSVARSNALTCAGRFSQCGSDSDFFSRCAPTFSIHSGSIFARQRAYSRLVSTSSAAITQRPAFFASTEPGHRKNLIPRAPR